MMNFLNLVCPATRSKKKPTEILTALIPIITTREW